MLPPSDNTPAPQFLTTREVASLLRVKERKVYELASSTEIPCLRVTGKLLFPRQALMEWLQNDGQAPSPAQHTQSHSGNPAPEQAFAPLREVLPVLPAVLAGSHDPLLEWAVRESGCGLAMNLNGSLDGLEEFVRSRALGAGLHVFNPRTEDWNIDRLTGQPACERAVLVQWAWRQQGVIHDAARCPVLSSLTQLCGLRVAIRQAASGAGLLFEHLLTQAGVSQDGIEWVDGPARTEAEAAALVASGKADAAPGLACMAAHYGLAFLPTRLERFDLLLDRRAWFEPPMQTLLAFTRTAAFARRAEELGGYELAEAGRVMWNG